MDPPTERIARLKSVLDEQRSGGVLQRAAILRPVAGLSVLNLRSHQVPTGLCDTSGLESASGSPVAPAPHSVERRGASSIIAFTVTPYQALSQRSPSHPMESPPVRIIQLSPGWSISRSHASSERSIQHRSTQTLVRPLSEGFRRKTGSFCVALSTLSRRLRRCLPPRTHLDIYSSAVASSSLRRTARHCDGTGYGVEVSTSVSFFRFGGADVFLDRTCRWSLYSYKARMKAVRLYIQYDRATAATVRELGYPTAHMLRAWYREFVESGDLHQDYRRRVRYSNEQKQKAVEHFCNHGRCVSKTSAALGYPNRETLRMRIDELRPGLRKVSIRRGSTVLFSDEQKRRAVVDLCLREGSAAAVPGDVGVSRPALYAWKNLPPSVSKDDVLATGDSTLVFFIGSDDRKKQLLRELALLDRPIPQIRYELLVVQYQDTAGLNWELSLCNGASRHSSTQQRRFQIAAP